MKKSQAALEFLSTYAWAFVVIAITIGALYYSGIFDFTNFLPSKCIFPIQFKCLDFSLQPTRVRVRLVNNLGEDIRINTISITNDATPPVSCTAPATPFVWPASDDQDLLFINCANGGYVSGERAELKLEMTYYAIKTSSQPSHTINGKINGKISS